MGLIDRLFSRNETVAAEQPKKKQDIVVGAGKENDLETIQSFSNSNFTFSGELADFDYVGILRNKQDNIQRLYQLMDYYTDADPIVHGIIKHVFVPFLTCSDWYLTGSKKKTYALYQEQYKRMRLREKIDAIMFELAKYNNVCCYLHNGDLITLPVNKWVIGNTMFNGTPIVDYDCQSIINELRTKTYSVEDKYVKDSQQDYILKGYPEEIQKAAKAKNLPISFFYRCKDKTQGHCSTGHTCEMKYTE